MALVWLVPIEACLSVTLGSRCRKAPLTLLSRDTDRSKQVQVLGKEDACIFLLLEEFVALYLPT